MEANKVKVPETSIAHAKKHRDAATRKGADGFLKQIKGKQVQVKLNDGSMYYG